MKLCVDVGNTTILFGFYKDDSLYERIFLNTNTLESRDTYYLSISTLCEEKNINKDDIEYILYSSVVPKINSELKKALHKLFVKAEIFVLDPSKDNGVKMTIDNPKEVGSDLIADLVGACHKYSLPLVVIDLGTATKMLLVDKDGYFSSALIMPGLKVSADSLFVKAALLPEVDLDNPTNLLDSKNTLGCIKHGILFGHLESIVGLTKRYENELGYSLTKIITGGNSSYLSNLLGQEFIKDENLVLDGELLILNKYLKERGI